MAEPVHTITVSSYDLTKYRLINTEDKSEWQPVWRKRFPWSPLSDGRFVWQRVPARLSNRLPEED